MIVSKCDPDRLHSLCTGDLAPTLLPTMVMVVSLTLWIYCVVESWRGRETYAPRFNCPVRYTTSRKEINPHAHTHLL